MIVDIRTMRDYAADKVAVEKTGTTPWVQSVWVAIFELLEALVKLGY